MKLLITESEHFSSKAIADLQQHFEVRIENIQTREELLLKSADCEVIFIRLGFNIDQEVIQNAKNLKYILTATTGLDHIDVAYFESQGGQVISLKNEVDFLGTIPSTAEHTWGLLLALLRKIPFGFEHVKQGDWNRNSFKGNNLKGKKIGILGLGRVGKQVAHFAEAFGMEVGFFDTVSIPSNYKQHNTAADLFQWADIISIHIPLTPENVGFVNKKLFQNSKPLFIINTSRGAVWDENDMASLLKEGKLVGLATDVITDELESQNRKNNPLIALANQHYNVIVTPHIAGATFESMAMTEAFIAQKFLQQHKNKI